MTLKFTKTDLELWTGTITELETRLHAIGDASYAFASSIMSILDALSKLKKKPPTKPEDGTPQDGTPKKVPPNTSDYIQRAKELVAGTLIQQLEIKIDEALGENTEDIKVKIEGILKELRASITSFELEDCIEQLPSDGNAPGGLIATGYKIDNETLSYWSDGASQIKEGFEQLKQINPADIKAALVNILQDLPGYVADQIEQPIMQRINGLTVSRADGIKAAVEASQKLVGYLNPGRFAQCKTPEKPKPDAPPIPKGVIIERPEEIDPPKDPKPDPKPTPIPDPTGDCCKDLVIAINNLNNSAIDYQKIRDLIYSFVFVFYQYTIRWIKETRTELKEARTDIKKILPSLDKLYVWVRDLRTEHFAHWKETQRVSSKSDNILSRLSSIDLAIYSLTEDVEKIRRAMELYQDINTLVFDGISTQINGVNLSVGASLAAILSAISASKREVIDDVDKQATTINDAITTNGLTLRTEILKSRVETAKGFNKLDDDLGEIKKLIKKVLKAVDFLQTLCGICFSAITLLIGGVSVAIGAALAAILAEIAAASTAILTEIGVVGATIEASLAAGFLKTQLELMRSRLQMARGFSAIEDILQLPIDGDIKSYDFRELTDKEKKERDDAEKKAKEAQQLQQIQHIFPANGKIITIEQAITQGIEPLPLPKPAIEKYTPTSDIERRDYKLDPKELKYSGKGLSGVQDLLTRMTIVLNDIQSDMKGGGFQVTEIVVPTIAWIPNPYPMLKGKRDYKNERERLVKVKLDLDGDGQVDFEYVKTPEMTTPYTLLDKIKVPIGMEEMFYKLYEQRLDDFWANYQNQPLLMLPEGWEFKPMRYRPQLQVKYEAVDKTKVNSYGKVPQYMINVQHYDFARLGKPGKAPLPKFWKGKWMGIMVLNDNSKDVVFAKSIKEGLKVFEAMIEITIPEMVSGIKIVSEDEYSKKISFRPIAHAPDGDEIMEIEVEPKWCDYFSTAVKNRTTNKAKDWRVRFDMGNLF